MTKIKIFAGKITSLATWNASPYMAQELLNLSVIYATKKRTQLFGVVKTGAALLMAAIKHNLTI